jgi:hypothetical protein
MTETKRRPTTEIIEELQAYAAEQFAIEDGEHLLAELCVETARRLYELNGSVQVWRNAAERLTAGINA